MGRNTLSDKQRGWLEHIDACASGGGSMKVYAENHGLNLQRFFSQWRQHRSPKRF